MLGRIENLRASAESPRPAQRGEADARSVAGEGQAERDRAHAWAVAALSAILAAYATCFALRDTDIWWHLAAGRLMVEGRHFIYTDPFAADTLGRPWAVSYTH